MNTQQECLVTVDNLVPVWFLTTLKLKIYFYDPEQSLVGQFMNELKMKMATLK